MAKKAAKATKKKSARKPNAAFMKPVTPSAALAAVVGAKPMPRTEVRDSGGHSTGRLASVPCHGKRKSFAPVLWHW